MQLSKSSKIQRNSPCPCGSGKKYKKCCFIKDEAAFEQQREVRRKIEHDKEQESDQEEKTKKVIDDSIEESSEASGVSGESAEG